MSLTKPQINRLLRQLPITDKWPWSTNDGPTIDGHIEGVIGELCRKLRLKDRTEFEHYGSWYASYIDCWLFRPKDEFRFAEGNCFWGLIVLFSRLSHYFVLGEGQKAWDAADNRRSSYLPSFAGVDQLTQPAVVRLAPKVCKILNERGFVRLAAGDLGALLPAKTQVPTILTDPPFRHFDSLFYWED